MLEFFIFNKFVCVNNKTGAYAKLIITWDPNDKLPLYPSLVIVVDIVSVGSASAYGHNLSN